MGGVRSGRTGLGRSRRPRVHHEAAVRHRKHRPEQDAEHEPRRLVDLRQLHVVQASGGTSDGGKGKGRRRDSMRKWRRTGILWDTELPKISPPPSISLVSGAIWTDQ